MLEERNLTGTSGTLGDIHAFTYENILEATLYIMKTVEMLWLLM